MTKFKKIARMTTLVIADAVIVIFSYLLALSLRFDSVFLFINNNKNIYKDIIIALPIAAAVYIIIFGIMKFYKTIWCYAGIRELLKVVIAAGISTTLSFALFSMIAVVTQGHFGLVNAVFPRSIFISVPIFVVFFVFAERMLLRLIIRFKNKRLKNTRSEINGRIMIIGAGDAASLLLNNLMDSDYYSGVTPVCLIDDDEQKQGLYIKNVKVMGKREDIIRLASEKKIDTIIFCIPSCPTEDKVKILKICQKTGCRLKTLPHIYQIETPNEISSKSIRNVEIEDLLGREPIQLETKSVMDYVNEKVVLVTGGGGSIGSELCRQIAANKPKQLVILDIYENNAYEIQNELLRSYPDLNLAVRIGSVRDSRRISQIFEEFRPQIVYHAAAHKHVPLMEDSPNEAIKNNVFGTLKTVRAADEFGVERFVLISTDKAVNPTNIMGASKRMCEMVVQAYNSKSKTDFVAVRFGNVLGSNGSVVPLFRKQIECGGPVTVTDPGIIRYFMTIPEAVSLVLQAGVNANGGEIFVLDMGEPVKIVDLAENLIVLSGYTPYVDIDIEFTGLRPGEKKFEELLMSEEGLTKTDNKLIYIGKPIEFDETAFLNSLDEFKENIYDDKEDIKNWVKKFVPTYNFPNS